MRLHFQHLRDTTNIGDHACSPFDYFDWGDAEISDVRQDDTPDYDVGIYGGGKIFGGLARYAGVRRRKGAVNIAWGVSTVQSFPLSWRYSRARRRMDVIGTRDYQDKRFIHAPCASCMAPFFDAVPAPTQDVVFYAHKSKTPKMGVRIPAAMPTLDNHAGSLDQALRFIASGRTVVSNSYHGVYWALLMGRKVLCLPFSNKFGGYRMPPHYATAQTWEAEVSNAIAQPGILAQDREATVAFRKIVDGYLVGDSPR